MRWRSASSAWLAAEGGPTSGSSAPWLPITQRGWKPSRMRTSATLRPVTTATGRRCASWARPWATASGTCASPGRATIGASVPSKSKARIGWRRMTSASACSPSGVNRCLIGVHLVSLHPCLDALAQARSPGVGEHAAGPAVDVELAHRRAQARHALALLGRRHGDRAQQRVGRFLDVVRVDDQRFGHLARGAGEAAQDEHALVVVARRDELLAYEV